MNNREYSFPGSPSASLILLDPSTKHTLPRARVSRHVNPAVRHHSLGVPIGGQGGSQRQPSALSGNSMAKPSSRSCKQHTNRPVAAVHFTQITIPNQSQHGQRRSIKAGLTGCPQPSRRVSRYSQHLCDKSHSVSAGRRHIVIIYGSIHRTKRQIDPFEGSNRRDRWIATTKVAGAAPCRQRALILIGP